MQFISFSESLRHIVGSLHMCSADAEKSEISLITQNKMDISMGLVCCGSTAEIRRGKRNMEGRGILSLSTLAT